MNERMNDNTYLLPSFSLSLSLSLPLPAEGDMLGALNQTVGKAIEAMGPEAFLRAMPFEEG